MCTKSSLYGAPEAPKGFIGEPNQPTSNNPKLTGPPKISPCIERRHLRFTSPNQRRSTTPTMGIYLHSTRGLSSPVTLLSQQSEACTGTFRIFFESCGMCGPKPETMTGQMVIGRLRLSLGEGGFSCSLFACYYCTQWSILNIRRGGRTLARLVRMKEAFAEAEKSLILLYILICNAMQCNEERHISHPFFFFFCQMWKSEAELHNSRSSKSTSMYISTVPN